MRCHDIDRLADGIGAIEALEGHLARGGLDDGLIYDAVRVRLVEIGEAVKDIDASVLALEGGIPWRAIARMRDQLAHRHFDTDHSIVADVVEHELQPLRAAVRRLLERLNADGTAH